MKRPTRGDRIEVNINGEWYPATFTGLGKRHYEFWAKTDAGGSFPVSFSAEGSKWRWPLHVFAGNNCTRCGERFSALSIDAPCSGGATQATAQLKQTGGK